MGKTTIHHPFGNGNQTISKHGDDWGMVFGIVYPHKATYHGITYTEGYLRILRGLNHQDYSMSTVMNRKHSKDMIDNQQPLPPLSKTVSSAASL